MQQMTEEQRKELEEKIKKMSPEELKEFQKQQCIFCQIISGKIPSKKVYEDEKCIAVMDINPAAIGHVLLLPKEHYAIMPQVPDEEIGHLFMVAKRFSQIMLRKLKVEGTTIFVANGQIAGQNAQHFMIHIIPRREGDGVLELSKRLVDEPLQKKLGEIAGKKADELFGVKRKVKEEEPVGEEKGEDKEEEPEEIKEEEKSETPVEGMKEEDKEEETEEKEEEKKDGEADLDNIAEMFK